MASSAPDLDKTDYLILYELEQNCRRSIREIAEKAGISKRMAEYRIARLMKKGVILGYAAIFDNSKLGYINHDVWIQLGDVSEERRSQFIAALIKNKHITWVATCGGKFDIAISILAEDVITFSDVLDSILSENSDIVLNYFITITTRFFNYPRTHLIEHGMKLRKAKSLFGGPPRKADLSPLDLHILSILSSDAKTSAVDIAAKTKVSANTARLRLERLEKEGVVQGYRAILLTRELGFRTYEILINVGPMSPSTRKDFEAYCQSNPFISYFLSTIGHWDIDIALDAKSSDHFQEILNDIRAKFGSIIKEYEFIPIMAIHKSNYTPFLR